MKIFVPFALKDIGGPSSFAKKLKFGMEQRGHVVTFEFCEDYDVLLLIVQCPLRYVLHAKRRKKLIAQRLDGVYYWSVAPWKFPLFNAKATYIRHLFADHTIYQSHYSQDCVERYLGTKHRDPSTIIYNGVDLDQFSPNGSKLQLRETSAQTIFFTASAFRRKDQILPLLEAMKEYRRRYSDTAKLVVVGSFVGEVALVPSRYKHLSYVQFVGKVSNADLPAYERAADVFLFTHLNPPCPNNIIEAMACGLPICGIADGAMPELVEHEGNGLLLPSLGDAFWHKRLIDSVEFARQMQSVVERRVQFGSASRQRAEKQFSLEHMIDRYIQVATLAAG